MYNITLRHGVNEMDMSEEDSEYLEKIFDERASKIRKDMEDEFLLMMSTPTTEKQYQSLVEQFLIPAEPLPPRKNKKWYHRFNKTNF